MNGWARGRVLGKRRGGHRGARRRARRPLPAHARGPSAGRPRRPHAMRWEGAGSERGGLRRRGAPCLRPASSLSAGPGVTSQSYATSVCKPARQPDSSELLLRPRAIRGARLGGVWRGPHCTRPPSACPGAAAERARASNAPPPPRRVRPAPCPGWQHKLVGNTPGPRTSVLSSSCAPATAASSNRPLPTAATPGCRRPHVPGVAACGSSRPGPRQRGGLRRQRARARSQRTKRRRRSRRAARARERPPAAGLAR